MANAQLEHGLLSPAPSDVSTVHHPSDNLPIPRSHPLVSGSSKESSLINYIDDRILKITRRYAKSFTASPDDQERDSGYTTFDQVVNDIDPILDVVWISATPSVQIPYLLALAGHFRGFMHSFPFVTNSFYLARKFDLAFSRLLTSLMDGSSPSSINMTDRVRIRSLAQETRFEMIEVASKSGHSVEQHGPSSDDEETDADGSMTDNDDSTNNQSVALGIGKVYEKTLEILGADLGSLPPPDQGRGDATPQFPDDVEIIDL